MIEEAILKGGPLDGQYRVLKLSARTAEIREGETRYRYVKVLDEKRTPPLVEFAYVEPRE